MKFSRESSLGISLVFTAVSRKVVQQYRTRQCRKVLWEMGVMVFDWGFRCFGDVEGNITNKSIYAFSFFVGKHCEPQSINAKLFLPIIPIGIVAYALTLLWDNLCRNSCIAMTDRVTLLVQNLLAKLQNTLPVKYHSKSCYGSPTVNVIYIINCI